MWKNTLTYSYSTKNFHRFSAETGTGVPREIYIPREVMAHPRATLEVEIKAALDTVAVKAKPVKE